MDCIVRTDGKVRKISHNKLMKRAYPEYYDFKKSVLFRDGYKCICCGKDYELKVHHLDGFDNFPEKRLDLSNAVTLCENCHKNFHLLYGRGNNTKEQFEKWFGSVKDIVSKEVPNLNETRPIYCYETDTYYKGCTDLRVQLKMPRSFSKSIFNSCNLKGNDFSVKGYHFLWGDVANKMNEQELTDYILHKLDNPRRPFVLDLLTGFVFFNGLERDKHYGLKPRSSTYRTRVHKTVKAILSHNTNCILYKDFDNLNKDEQNLLLKDKTIKIYREV